MKRFALTALTAVLFASGSSLAMAQATSDPDATAKEELQQSQPQAKVEAAQTGEQTEADMEKVGQESGAEGTTASLVTEDEKIEKESDVEGAESEEMMEKGDTATIN
jgi:hypothetical protein